MESERGTGKRTKIKIGRRCWREVAGGESGLRAGKGGVYSINSEAREQLLRPHYRGGLETAYREGVTKNNCTPEGWRSSKALRSHYSQRKQG